jgi:gas vesicle protein
MIRKLIHLKKNLKKKKKTSTSTYADNKREEENETMHTWGDVGPAVSAGVRDSEDKASKRRLLLGDPRGLWK